MIYILELLNKYIEINLIDSYFNHPTSEKTFYDILEPLVKEWGEENIVTEYLPRMPIIQGVLSATVKKSWTIKYYWIDTRKQ